MLKHKLIIPVLLVVSMESCVKEAVLNQTMPIVGGKWAYTDTKRFNANIKDTLTAHNFYFEVRHSGNYEYQNLIICFKTYFPNHTFKIDTIDCPMADASGKWFGSGLGDILDNPILFKRNLQFPAAGDYQFEIQHAMRQDTVKEIYDVGLRISKVQNK